MRRAPSTSAMTLAASVLPTPASPSMNSGFSSFKARKIDVARARSPMYLRSRSRCSTSSIVAGEVAITRERLREGRWPGVSAGPPCVLLRLLDRPLGQDPGQMLLVLRARPEVAGRAQAVGCVLRCVLRLGAVMESLFNGMGTHGRRAHVGQADAPAAVHLLGRGTDNRPVEKPAAELDVLVRAVRYREDDLDDDLVRLERR